MRERWQKKKFRDVHNVLDDDARRIQTDEGCMRCALAVDTTMPAREREVVIFLFFDKGCRSSQ